MSQIRTFQDCFHLYTPKWCGTCYVDQNVIVLTETHLEILASRMLILKAYTTIYIYIYICIYIYDFIYLMTHRKGELSIINKITSYLLTILIKYE